MGREIKRVPLDFDWPMNRIWPGYMFSVCGTIEDYFGKYSDEMCNLCRQFARLKFGEVVDSPDSCPSFDEFDFPPPEGEGYQLWETTSEGSPISPVFDTPEKLARWLADNGASTFADMTADYETWLEFIKGPGWAPSAAITNKGMESGVDAMCAFEKEADDAE